MLLNLSTSSKMCQSLFRDRGGSQGRGGRSDPKLQGGSVVTLH